MPRTLLRAGESQLGSSAAGAATWAAAVGRDPAELVVGTRHNHHWFLADCGVVARSAVAARRVSDAQALKTRRCVPSTMMWPLLWATSRTVSCWHLLQRRSPRRSRQLPNQQAHHQPTWPPTRPAASAARPAATSSGRRLTSAEMLSRGWGCCLRQDSGFGDVGGGVRRRHGGVGCDGLRPGRARNVHAPVPPQRAQPQHCHCRCRWCRWPRCRRTATQNPCLVLP